MRGERAWQGTRSTAAQKESRRLCSGKRIGKEDRSRGEKERRATEKL